MKKYFTLLLFICYIYMGTAQSKPNFKDDIEAIKTYDKIYETSLAPIVFTGSSSIRKWSNLQVAFGSYNVINRGIGGAVINDITYYLNDLVFVYKPSQIVIYVGENNLPDESETPQTITDKTIILFNSIRARLPQVPIVYISMKPSPSRDGYQQKCKSANDLINKFISSQEYCTYVDVYTPMLKDGKSRPELFTNDMLHLNEAGYKLWQQLVEPSLIKPKHEKRD